MKRSTSLLLSLSFCLFVSSAYAVNKGDISYERLRADPPHLNTIIGSDGAIAEIGSYIFETLLRYNPDTLAFEPNLAQSYTVSPDGLQYTFKLRKDITFSDGKPLTADDVLFTWRIINDEKVDAAHLRNYYQDVKAVEKVDDHTIKFVYKRKYFRAIIIMGAFEVLPKHIYGHGDFNKHPANRHPIGSGPYKFMKWDSGEQIVLERRKGWWGLKDPILKDRYNFDRKVYKIINDDSAGFLRLQKGELDVADLTEIQWVKQTNSKRFSDQFDKIKYSTVTGGGYRYIGWNLRNPLFADQRVRQALTHLINREEIVEKFFYGLLEVARGPFSERDPRFSQKVKRYAYDPEAAKKILAEAGWEDSDHDGILEKDGREFEFEFMIHNAAQIYEKLVTVFQQNFKKAGIRMNIKTLEWAVFTKNIREHNFDAYAMGWGSSIDSDPYQLWHSSQTEGGSNYIGFKNSEVDKILETARAELDRDKRNRLYQRFHEILHEEQPYTWLTTYEPAKYAIHKRFAEVNIHKEGLLASEWYTPPNRIKHRAD